MTSAKPPERRAVIDVGTNSVKLLVADIGPTLRPVLKQSRQTRLGRGVFRAGRLEPEAIARTAAVVAEFAAEARALRARALRLLATSAVREASNGHELVQAIFLATGLTVEIISGDQEAEYVFRGVTSDPAIGPRPVFIVDVGGGSTEWVVGQDGWSHFRQSTRLGTSRLLELLPLSDPPTPGDLAHCRAVVAEFIGREVHPNLQPVLASVRDYPVWLVGLGGALKTLARLAAVLPPAIDGPLRLGWDQVSTQVERLWGLSAQQRRELKGLAPEKADVILAGAVIYETVMRRFDFPQLWVSSYGLRHGALIACPPGAPPRAAAPGPSPVASWFETRCGETDLPPAVLHLA
jgi:exopolyphosphatase/guanosine-5'-triphosphate,3'-diphosphate pyrophosphatase